MPEANLAARPGFVSPRRRLPAPPGVDRLPPTPPGSATGASPASDPCIDPNAEGCEPPPDPEQPGPSDPFEPGNGDRGIYLFQQTQNWYGVYQVNELRTGVQLATTSPDGAYVYAPTVLAPGGACVEVTQVYRRATPRHDMESLYGVWDWCESATATARGRFVVFQPQDRGFTDRYVRLYHGRPSYAISVLAPSVGGDTYGGCWYTSIYDYSTGSWAQMAARCGRPHHGYRHGWTMWESYDVANQSPCPVVPSIRALDVQLYKTDGVSNTTVPLYHALYDRSALVQRGACWLNGTYKFTLAHDDASNRSYWVAETPYP
jgi:hypothetical protein